MVTQAGERDVGVRANGSIGCLNVKKEGNTITTLKLQAHSLLSFCQKHTHFFSRDFSLSHEYARRCDSAGSCSIKKCATLQKQDDIPEISIESRRKPGYTECLAGCGGWNCGCFYSDPSCLFFRYVASPSSNQVYEIFSCPSWTTRLQVTIKLGQMQVSAELSPGVKYELPGTNISITATSFNTPPLQLHSATYVSSYSSGSPTPDNTAFSFTPPSAPGTPTKGLVEEFMCSSRKAAENFDCSFDPSLCRCTGFGTAVNCLCSNEKMEDYGKTNPLPVKGTSFSVDTINGVVASSSVEDTIVSLNIQLKNATLERVIHVQECQAHQVGIIHGCHSCMEGSKVTVLCRASTPMKALLNCGQIEKKLSIVLRMERPIN